MDSAILTGPASHGRFSPGSLPRISLSFLALLFSASLLRAQNPIQIENAKAGTTNWQITNLAFNHEIEGYASLTSVNRGGQISLFVNTSDPTYTIRIFRMGWYQGLGARLVLTTASRTGVSQPLPTADPTTGLIECNWSSPYVLTLNSTSDPVSNWVSGVYLALLTGSSGEQNYIIFVVRDDTRASKYFFQCAVDTYQAYNNWGGKSLYAFNSDGGNPAVKVSFNRPYGAGNEGGYGHDGAGDFVQGWEYDAVRFLEREGYDVTYGTDVDVHENAGLLLNHQADLIVGHSEYWSRAMRANVVAARDAGVSLGVFAANVCYWQIRFEPSTVNSAPDRTIVGYKDFAKSNQPPGPDPDYADCPNGPLCQYTTVRWRESPLNMPENAFLGVMYENDPVDGDILVTNASHPLFNTTGVQNGDTLAGLLGYEVDGLFDNGETPAGTVTLAASPYTVTGSNPPINGTSDMTIYTAGSGATVFASGSIQFAWGLDGYSLSPNVRVSFAAQQLTRNLLGAFISDQPPVADAGGSYSGTATQSVQFDGTGSTDPDGSVTTYEWDFGDGTTGTGSSPTHAYSLSGTYDVTLIVTDSEGSRNAATTTANISGVPTAGLSPGSLSFGSQVVGTSTQAQAVTLTNTGTDDLSITGISASGDYAQTNDCGTSVSVGSNCTIHVTFTPTTTGTRNGTLSIADNASGSPQTVSLSGTGIASAVSLSPGSLSFGDQLVGATSGAKAVTLTNSGSATLNISSIAVSGDYAQTNNCPSSLAPSAGCNISVTFTPTTTGMRTGALTITDDASGSPHTVGLSGTGVMPAVSLSASSLSFTSQLVGTTSTAKLVTLTNSGTDALSISSIGASGDFAETNDCGSSVAAGAHCTINVTFAPTATGTRTGTLTVTDNASGSPHTVALSGTGIAPAVSVSPGSLTFSSQLVGTTSAAQPVTLTNTGTATLNISGIATSGDFAQANDCGGSVTTEASCTINVTFAPTASGTRNGTLTVTDNAPGSPHTINLSGTGIAPVVSLSPGSLDFGNQLVELPSSSQAVTLTNTGTATLNISSIAASGDYTQSNNCGSSLAPSAGCTINVTLTPATTGTRSGTLTIMDSAAGSPHQVSLTGTGTESAVSLSPASLSFSDHLVGTSSAPQTVTLTNIGTATMTISSIEASTDYAQTNDCGSSVLAGSSCTISITFAPTAAGVRTGTIIITDSAAGSPQTVPLSGTGTDFAITPAAGSPTNATVTAGGTATFALTLAPSGLSGNVSFACTVQPAGPACSVSPNPLVLDGVNPASATVTVTTTARSFLAPATDSPPSGLGPRARPSVPVEWIWLLALALGASVWKLAGRRTKQLTPVRAALAAVVLLVALGTGCGGGGGGTTSTSLPPSTGTAAGTYTITVTGTSGSLSHTTTLTLTVN